MKNLLTSLLCLSIMSFTGDGLGTQPGTNGNRIGEVYQDLTVIGNSPQDWLTGCKKQGFYIAAYIRPDGNYQVYSFCGTIDPETKTFTIVVEQGI